MVGVHVTGVQVSTIVMRKIRNVARRVMELLIQEKTILWDDSTNADSLQLIQRVMDNFRIY